MKKYIISEHELKDLIKKYCGYDGHETSEGVVKQFLRESCEDLQEYKEPEQEPKFKEGDIVYHADGVAVKRAEFVNYIYDHDFIGATIKNSIGRTSEIGIERLFKTPIEAFDFLEREK